MEPELEPELELDEEPEPELDEEPELEPALQDDVDSPVLPQGEVQAMLASSVVRRLTPFHHRTLTLGRHAPRNAASPPEVAPRAAAPRGERAAGDGPTAGCGRGAEAKEWRRRWRIASIRLSQAQVKFTGLAQTSGLL